MGIDDEGNVFFNYYDASGTQQHVYYWPDDDELPTEVEHEFPRMLSTAAVFDPKGNLLVAYYTGSTPGKVVCIYRAKGGTWGDVETVSTNSASWPRVVLHGNDSFHIVVDERNETADVDLAAYRYVPGLGLVQRQDLGEASSFDHSSELASFSNGRAILGFERYIGDTGQTGDARVLWYW